MLSRLVIESVVLPMVETVNRASRSSETLLLLCIHWIVSGRGFPVALQRKSASFTEPSTIFSTLCGGSTIIISGFSAEEKLKQVHLSIQTLTISAHAMHNFYSTALGN